MDHRSVSASTASTCAISSGRAHGDGPVGSVHRERRARVHDGPRVRGTRIVRSPPAAPRRAPSRLDASPPRTRRISATDAAPWSSWDARHAAVSGRAARVSWSARARTAPGGSLAGLLVRSARYAGFPRPRFWVLIISCGLTDSVRTWPTRHVARGQHVGKTAVQAGLGARVWDARYRVVPSWVHAISYTRTRLQHVKCDAPGR